MTELYIWLFVVFIVFSLESFLVLTVLTNKIKAIDKHITDSNNTAEAYVKLFNHMDKTFSAMCKLWENMVNQNDINAELIKKIIEYYELQKKEIAQIEAILVNFEQKYDNIYNQYDHLRSSFDTVKDNVTEMYTSITAMSENYWNSSSIDDFLDIDLDTPSDMDI